ncbi:MAG: hypothetical protein JRI25_06145 [Deltaproteobacteria bacterium]|nr:hypothetical protein [Deltaproteobacteria bacterium]MBW2254165.1 hypothetical protein [Deltaproteobacteria bacterium]
MRCLHFALVLAGLLAVGCDDAGDEGSFITPLDGQTAVALDALLRVRAPTLGVPPEYPLPELIRVVDLAEGGFVPGEVVDEGDVLSFVPRGSWAVDRRYVWTVDIPEGMPHGPELHIAGQLSGSAVFDTSEAIAVLAAGLDDDDRACLVLSRRTDVGMMEGARVTADDEEIADLRIELQGPEVWQDQVWVPGLRPEVDLACLVADESIAPGTRLRVWWAGSGPWVADVEDISPAELVVELHRGGL